MTDDHLGENDEVNPLIEGSLRKSDCGQVTDGAAAIFLASREVAEAYAKRRGISIDAIPRIKGWGHSTAPSSIRPRSRAAAASLMSSPACARR